MYINKVFLYGNLTRDPELKALPSGAAVCSFGIATNRNYKDKDGNKQEQVEYHNITMFGRQAEVANQYLKKGRPVFVDGRLQTRSWDDKETGKKMYRTEIIVDNFQFGPQAGDDAGKSFNGNQEDEPIQTKKEPTKTASKVEYPEDDINADDIPF
jgi:single-strand DNA-binding protein